MSIFFNGQFDEFVANKSKIVMLLSAEVMKKIEGLMDAPSQLFVKVLFFFYSLCLYSLTFTRLCVFF